MIKLRNLRAAIVVLFLVGFTSACKPNTQGCKMKSKSRLIDPDLITEFKDLGGKKVVKEYPCESDTNIISLDISLITPISVKLYAPENKKECANLKIKKVTTLGCGKTIEITIERNKLCSLNLITIVIEHAEMMVDKSKTKAFPNILTTILHTVVGADCNSACKGTKCIEKSKQVHVVEDILGGVIGHRVAAK